MKVFLVSAILFWLAAGAQESIAPRLAIASVTPNFLIVTLGSIALFTSRRTGAITGFVAGLLEGAAAGANLGAYVVSRTVTGFVTGWFTDLEFEANAILPLLAVAIATLCAQILLMFGAPPPQITRFLLATIGSAMYNGVLAIPLFLVLKRVLDPPSR